MGREPRGGGLLFAEFRAAERISRVFTSRLVARSVIKEGRARAPFSRPSRGGGRVCSPYRRSQMGEAGSHGTGCPDLLSFLDSREAETARAPIVAGLVDVASFSVAARGKKNWFLLESGREVGRNERDRLEETIQR